MQLSFIKLSLVKSFFTKSSLAKSFFTESVNITLQSKNNQAINYFNTARIQALILVKELQTLASMKKNIAVKITASQLLISEKTILKYIKTARI